MSEQAIDKANLEIEKLKAEIRFAKCNIWAQFATPAAILITGVIALLFFQKPQIAEMEAARISNESVQIENTLLTIQQLSNPQDKKLMLDALQRAWPLREEIKLVAEGNQLSSRPAPKPAETSNDRCAPFVSRLQELNDNISELKIRKKSEIDGLGSTAAGGPFARVINNQILNDLNEIAKLKSAAAGVSCQL